MTPLRSFVGVRDDQMMGPNVVSIAQYSMVGVARSATGGVRHVRVQYRITYTVVVQNSQLQYTLQTKVSKRSIILVAPN